MNQVVTKSASFTVTSELASWTPMPWPARCAIAAMTASDPAVSVA